MNAIESYGAYVPRFRIDASAFEDAWGAFEARGVSQKAVPASDEDAVTMAVEAIQNALDRSDYAPSDVATLAFGTTTPPLEEGDVGARVAEIVGLSRSTALQVHTQSTRAGAEAILSAARSSDGPAIAVAADCPLGEPDDAIDHAAGAGAVAFVVADDGPVTIEEWASHTREYPGTRFRERGRKTIDSYDATGYERDAYTTVVANAVDALEGTAPALAPTATDGSLPYRAGRAIEADAEVYEATSELGDTGAASPLFGLLAAWQDGEDEVILAGYGDGASADAIRFSGSLDGDWARATEPITYAEYLRKRGHVLSKGGGA